jgi:hypothetical protein
VIHDGLVLEASMRVTNTMPPLERPLNSHFNSHRSHHKFHRNVEGKC